MQYFKPALLIALYKTINAQNESSSSDSSTEQSSEADSSGSSESDIINGLGRNIATARSMLSVLLENDPRLTLPGGNPDNFDATTIARNLLKNYGCYCYAGGSKIVGSRFNYHGPAIDPVDDLCRQMFFKQKCFPLDAAEGMYDGNQCEGDNKFRWYLDDDNELVCGDRTDLTYYSRRPCKMQNCELEKNFVESVVELWFDPTYVQDKNFRNMEDGEYNAACTVPGGNGGSPHELKCCGEGIDRRTYNTMMKECCWDGSVKFIGNCPL